MLESGSRWRKWDLHLHTPGTAMNDQFAGATLEDKWESYVTAIEAAGELGAIGVTDYLGLSNFRRLQAFKQAGRLPDVGILLPNVELRILPVTNQEKAINIHVLACPSIVDELDTLLLATLEFRFQGNPYSCTVQSLASLGRAFSENSSLEEAAAIRAGVEQFKVDYGQIDRAFRESKKLRQHAIVAVAQHTTDGNSGIQESGLTAVRREIYRLSHLVLSGNPKDRVYFLGQGVDPAARILELYGALKPCVTGSDAHRLEDVGRVIMDRFTWIKADPTFEGLRQVLFEPEHRIEIGSMPPKVPMHRLRRVTLSLPDDIQLKWESSNSPFCLRGTHEIPFSAGLTCIIGGRGAGKSTLLNMIQEKLAPGSNEFWRDHQLRDSAGGAVAVEKSVTAEYAGDGMSIEVISQNEVEALALEPARLTKAMYTRLTTLGGANPLAALMEDLQGLLKGAETREDKLRDLQKLAETEADLIARLAGCEELLSCYSDPEYLESTARLQSQISAKGRLKDERVALLQVVQDLERVVGEALVTTETRFGLAGQYLIESVRDAIVVATAGKDLGVLQEDELALDAEATTLRATLEEFLTSRGLSAENLSDVASASEQKANLLASIRQVQTEVDLARKQMLSIVSPMPTRLHAEEQIQALLLQVNARFEAGALEARRIEIQYRFDIPAAEDACVEWLLQDMSQAGSTGKPRIDHARGVLDRAGPILQTSDEDLLSAISADETKAGQALDLYFARAPRLAVWRSVRERFQADLSRFMRLDVLYDGKRLERTSFGQRCSAVLITLLSLGNRPIIVDEPEAHLDSALIAGFMVDLIKRIKRDRQVIFATHNANFVVNGDAELIHILQPQPDGRTTIVSTTLEDLGHREEILALEGGEQAFRQREDRYGLDP